MATITTNGGGLLGTIGALAGVAGLATGNPWLSAIGMGANALSGNGNGALSKALGESGCWPSSGSGWTNPAAGGMVSGYDADTAIWQDMFKKNGGYPVWLQ